MQEAAGLLKVMSGETGLRIVCALDKGALQANSLADLTGQSASAASQQLIRLRIAGLVSSRRQGQTIFYRAQPGTGQELINAPSRHATACLSPGRSRPVPDFHRPCPGRAGQTVCLVADIDTAG